MTMVWPVASLCRMYIFRGALAVKDDDSTVLSQSSISPSDEPLAAWLAVEDGDDGDGSAAAEETAAGLSTGSSAYLPSSGAGG